MRVLTVDIGTGTQDIFLYDSALDLENGYKLVMPSPTMMVHRQIKAATERRAPVLLTGTLMGGGPSQWAARDHILAGHPLYATPGAARTFNDDLDYVQREMGVRLVSDDETRALNAPQRGGDVVRVELKDFDYRLIAQAFAEFGVKLEIDALAVAVFDHGDAPPGYSDRQFRFDYLDNLVRGAGPSAGGTPDGARWLSAFAHRAEAVPPKMTRLKAVVDSARAQGVDALLLVMDTAPAAVLGATLDPVVAARLRDGALVANIGNFHCLAFRLGPTADGRSIGGLFEHHTGEVTRAKLDGYLSALADSTLRHQDVFDDMGHGALVYDPTPLPAPYFLAVTGPRRNLMRGPAGDAGRRLTPYFAVPFGDMMIVGCYGLLAALANAYPELAGPIRDSFAGVEGTAPWDAV